jgi:hypothetical protein
MLMASVRSLGGDEGVLTSDQPAANQMGLPTHPNTFFDNITIISTGLRAGFSKERMYYISAEKSADCIASRSPSATTCCGREKPGAYHGLAFIYLFILLTKAISYLTADPTRRGP